LRILLVEDDVRVAEALGQALRGQNHALDAVGTCTGAREYVRGGEYELAIIDIGLPDGTGVDLCRELRAGGRDLPILLLTARGAVSDRVGGLDAGADDYMAKPFATEELLARVRALGRRGPRWKDSKRTFGRLVVDLDRRSCTKDGATVPLTPREFDLVSLLAWRDGRVVPRDEVLETVWGDVTEGAARSLDVLVARLRRKLDDPEGPSYIRTIRQVGYAWMGDERARANPGVRAPG
jgi:DNA-binding response OmpR family regulator